MNAIGAEALGAWIDDAAPALYYEPISRIQSGGGIAKPAQLAVLGVDLINDEGDYIVNDNDEIIGTEE